MSSNHSRNLRYTRGVVRSKIDMLVISQRKIYLASSFGINCRQYLLSLWPLCESCIFISRQCDG